MYYIALIAFFFLSELLYLHIAKRFSILDVPNRRSAHKKVTIRGIGIIFPLAVVTFFLLNNFQYPYFIIGLLLVSTISFIDDIRHVPNRFRIIVQFASMGILLYELYLSNGFLGALITLAFVIIGMSIINAFNFMDGINGITGLYSLVVLITFYYINSNVVSFIDKQLLMNVSTGICVFLFFNFRKRAIGFCGDVGSVSVAYIITFCLGMLILNTGEWRYLLFFSLYGLDTGYTLIYRALNKENIFKAHKLHFYQLLIHEQGLNHLLVSVLYSGLQLLLNILIISFDSWPVYFFPLIFISIILHFCRVAMNRGIIVIPNNKM